MPIIQTKAGGVSYEVHGTGEPLVLLRGLGRSVRHWLGYDQQVMARSFQVITLDLRGMGQSMVPCTWGTTVGDMADDVVSVLDHLGLPSAHILGVSLGGMVALAMGLRCPERCRSLIVINTSVGGQGTLRLTPQALGTLGAVALGRGDDFQARLVESLVGPDCPAERRVEVAQRYGEIAAEDGLYVKTVVKQLCAAGRFAPARQLRTMALPTLVVCGTNDRFVPNANSRKLVQRLPDAKLLEVAGGGHELSLDKGEELAGAVRAWVADLAARPAAST